MCRNEKKTEREKGAREQTRVEPHQCPPPPSTSRRPISSYETHDRGHIAPTDEVGLHDVFEWGILSEEERAK